VTPTATPVQARLPVALIGAGQIGRAHTRHADAHPDVRVCGVADPSDDARQWARAHGLPWHADPAALLDAVKPAAAIVATPNALHREAALACIDRGVPVLVEKPVADTLEAGLDVVRAGLRAGVPVMVGHQRRHNPIAREARRLVDEGVLGRPVAANVLAAWLKPDPYFQVAWRREPGGGPVLINLIHDVDLLRFLLGDVVSVQAQSSSAVRGFPVEDTAAVVMRLANGALATLLTTDTVASPWNWDLAAGEAAHFPRQDIDSHTLMGTEGSLTLPRLSVWRYAGARGWHERLTHTRSVPHTANPYDEQLRHLRAVAEGRETPLCSGLDGLRTLQATLAVLASARTGSPEAVEPLVP
jgi:predicted dehydrogenase